VKPGGAPDCRRSRQNWRVRFLLFWAGAFSSCLIRVTTHFGDSTGESTTSHTNRSDLDKNNIIKPTFDTLTEEGHKAYEAYWADLKELFLSHCEVMWQGTVLKDPTPIIICKADVIPKVRPNSPPSLNDVKSMSNSAWQREAKSTDELLHRLIEEWDGKKLDSSIVNLSSSCAANFAQTNPQTSVTSMDDTTMPSTSAQPMNHFCS
jgi:hypothetical protein